MTPRLIRHLTRWTARALTRLRDRLAELRQAPDAGSHAVEYAVGIFIGLATMALVYAAYKAGLTHIIATWATDLTGT